MPAVLVQLVVAAVSGLVVYKTSQKAATNAGTIASSVGPSLLFAGLAAAAVFVMVKRAVR